MLKVWMAATAALVVAVSLGVLVSTGKLALPGNAQAKAAETPGDKKKDVALQFAPKEVVQPAYANMPQQVQFSGPLVAPDTVVVRSKAAGTLLALSVAEGSRVNAGQALGRVDLSDVASRVAERQAMLENARVQQTQAERTLASNQRLADQGFISPNALDTSRHAVDSARAQANAAKASLDAAQVGLREAAVVAPIAGIVAKRHAVAGEKVAMEQPVVTIVNLQRLEVMGSVATHEVSRLQPGMAVQVQVEGAEQAVPARIARIAPAAEAGTRSIGVTIELVNSGERFRAGQYAVASVVLPDEKRRLTLPLAAVASSGGESHVWVLEGGQLKRRAVIVGRRDEREGRVEVLEGLSPAATVLAARFDNLRDGAQASVVASKPAPVASASAPAALR